MTVYRGVAVGSRAPSFTAPLTHPDGSTAETDFESLLTDGSVLLAFFPSDFTSECTREWCAFRDDDWFASGDNVRVVGVSPNPPSTHRRFVDSLDLPFPLFSDANRDIAEAYAVGHTTAVPTVVRSLFYVDTAGDVRYVWKSDNQTPTHPEPGVRAAPSTRAFDTLTLQTTRRAISRLALTEPTVREDGTDRTSGVDAPAATEPSAPSDGVVATPATEPAPDGGPDPDTDAPDPVETDATDTDSATL